MEKKKKDCGTLIAVLLTGVVFGAIAGMVLLSLFYPVFQSDKWAAWVQAVGSIGAIMGSYFIGSHLSGKSHELELLRREDEAEKRLEGYYLVIVQTEFFGETVKDILEKAWQPDDISHEKLKQQEELATIQLKMYWRGGGRFLAETLLSSLQEMPLNEFKKPSDVTLLIGLTGALQREVKVMNNIFLSDDFRPNSARKHLSGLWNGMNILCVYSSQFKN